ncbi:MAG TPA: hypothetical protein VFJ19_11070 [Nocardioidaceae bacterium]|nr:hypothetical protein [Nocardioidaceae bacterium]
MEDNVSIDETGVEEDSDEVAVLVAEGAELGDAEVLLVEAPASETGLPRRRGAVGVLHLHDPVAPAFGKDRGIEADAVDAEAVLCLERRQFAGDTLHEIGQARGSSVVSAMGSTSTSIDTVAAEGRPVSS